MKNIIRITLLILLNFLLAKCTEKKVDNFEPILDHSEIMPGDTICISSLERFYIDSSTIKIPDTVFIHDTIYLK